MVHYKRSKSYLGIVGAAGVGKTTVANSICNKSSTWTLVSFADELKNVCSVVFDIERHMFDSFEEKEKIREPICIDSFLHRLSSHVCMTLKPHGLVADSYRKLLQYVGTDYIRSESPNHWIETTLRNVKKLHNIVWADVRFENEIEAIHSLGGEIIAIEREGISYSSDHPSARDLSALADHIILFPNSLETVDRWAHLYTKNFSTWKNYEKHKVVEFLRGYQENRTMESLSEIFGMTGKSYEHMHLMAESFGIKTRVDFPTKYRHSNKQGTEGKVCCTCQI